MPRILKPTRLTVSHRFQTRIFASLNQDKVRLTVFFESISKSTHIRQKGNLNILVFRIARHIDVRGTQIQPEANHRTHHISYTPQSDDAVTSSIYRVRANPALYQRPGAVQQHVRRRVLATARERLELFLGEDRHLLVVELVPVFIVFVWLRA